MAEIQFFNVEQLVRLDEPGSDNRDHVRKMGYAMRGDRPVYHRLLHRGQRSSSVAAMCSDGVIALELQEGTFNGYKFVEFIAGSLIPEMNQFDGSSERSVLVMDNCSIHYVSPTLYTNALGCWDSGYFPTSLQPRPQPSRRTLQFYKVLFQTT